MIKWLIGISGARPEILTMCPTERTKFISLGWAMIIASGVAGVSLWVALTDAIGLGSVLAVPAAIAWGFVIMGIHRWLVTSAPGNGARKALQLLPRLLVILLIGVIVAVPLVLRVFTSEINAEIAVMQEVRYATFLQDTQQSAIGRNIAALNEQVSSLENTIAAGPHKAGYKQAVDILPVFQSQLKAALEQQSAMVNVFAGANSADDGLIPRLQALSQAETDDVTLSTAADLLVVLFIVIEALPLTVRQMQPPGNYERILAEAQRRELLDARWYLLGQTTGSQPTEQEYRGREDRDIEVRAVWEAHVERRGLGSAAEDADATEPELEPAASYEHARYEDAALATLDDTRISDWPTPPEGIPLHYDDDDL